MLADSRPVTIHCKAGSGLFLNHEPNVKILLSDVYIYIFIERDNGILYEIDSPFCNTKTTFSAKTTEDREIGKQFAPFSEGVG